MEKALKQAGKILYNLPEYVSWVALLLLIVLNFSGVIFRYCFNSPFKFGEEATKFLFVWLVMLGTACAAKSKKHVHLDFLTEKLPLKIQRVLEIIIIVTEICVYVILIVITVQLCGITTQRTPVFKVNYRYIYSSVVVSGIYFIWYVSLHLVYLIKGEEQKKDKEDLA